MAAIETFRVPPMREVMPDGTVDEFNEWIVEQVARALTVTENVLVIYSDDESDLLGLDDEGNVVTVPKVDDDPEMEPILEDDGED